MYVCTTLRLQQVAQLSLTDPRDAEVQHMLNVSYRIVPIYKVAESVRLCVCVPDFGKTCVPISVKLFMVHRDHR